MSVTTTDNLTGQIVSAVQQKINVKADPLRNEALQIFQELGLPAPKHEEYKHTPIARYLEKNFSFAASPASGPLADIKRFFIPGVDANVIVMIDGVFSQAHSRVISPETEIKIQSLGEALAAKNPVATQHFAKYLDIRNNSLAAWNTAAWNQGIFIHVPDNKVVETPVIIYYISNATAGENIVVNRNLIVAGKNSQATVVEKFDSTGSANHFTNLVTEVFVDENAGLDLYSIQHDLNNRFQHNITEIFQKNSSRVNTFTFTLQGKFFRNNLHLALDGEGIESHMYGLYLLNSDTLADNHTVVDHKKPNSFSNELYKGIMDESSKGIFNGKIFVRPNAQKTNAFQANRNILLTDKATVNTKPQLEIWADDVKCSHGCTTGQLDEEALFYLQSRGINKDTARAMMLYAFAGEVLDYVKHPQLKDYLDSVISDRLHKNF
ncbi:Fe-S cluster assembly protein SufD [Fulvivirgaceae bacterium PWU4]|uniref:Fe-S cluster assembly protein SufD n=1 Tax=Chryseosolibacter histidini TaxID=2782349 RepID=A0AAP2GKZ9_9BACT|nr:Fe-S cluster assembly protein SufD [Chryseosolibacter histidini]MBT1699876.1 Fe-S cluster assembly protein SufD [Chryseosolibacter histidini]